MDRSAIVAALVMLSLVLSASSQGSKSGHCPLPKTVTRCMNRCKTDYDCSESNKCCLNTCGSTSCADTTSISTGYDDRYNTGDNTAYCNNVKCQQGEKCVFDKSTKREKCGRS